MYLMKSMNKYEKNYPKQLIKILLEKLRRNQNSSIRVSQFRDWDWFRTNAF